MRIAIVALLVGLQCFGALATVVMVGKERKATTGATAAVTIVISGLFIAGILYLA